MPIQECSNRTKITLIKSIVMSREFYIGLISGTSIDGVDCTLVAFEGTRLELVATHFEESKTSLREHILELSHGTGISLSLFGETHVAVGKIYANAVQKLLRKTRISAKDITAIGSHGQTIWHKPTGKNPFTIQIGDPNTIAQNTGITTITDFRQKAIVLGGQGAPLAPLVHRELFLHDNFDRAIINIGGMANITALPANGACFAYDTGPGNVLMDYWISKNQEKRYDENGSWGASGECNKDLLKYLLADPYFSLKPPKSTGRELFNKHWLKGKLREYGKPIKPKNLQATLSALTATSIANAVSDFCSTSEVYICGGGVHNKFLMENLRAVIPNPVIKTTQSLGIDPDWVESVTFAWMAKQTIENRQVDTTAFTGSAKPSILGGVYKGN